LLPLSLLTCFISREAFSYASRHISLLLADAAYSIAAADYCLSDIFFDRPLFAAGHFRHLLRLLFFDTFHGQ